MLKLILASSTVLSEEPVTCADFGAEEFCRRRVEDDCSLILEAEENLEDCLRRMDLIMDSCNFDCAVDRRMEFTGKGVGAKRRLSVKGQPEFKGVDSKRRLDVKGLLQPKRRVSEKSEMHKGWTGKRRFDKKSMKGFETGKRRFEAEKGMGKGMVTGKRRFEAEKGMNSMRRFTEKRNLAGKNFVSNKRRMPTSKSFVKRGLESARDFVNGVKRRLSWK